MKILSIETSCDETAAAVVEAEKGDTSVKLLANTIVSSLELHAQTGGIIPEMAARKQLEYIIPVIEKTLKDAKLFPPDIDSIAVTYGPGLIGSLLIGVETAKTLAFVWNKPLIPVNHLYGHIYANFITTNNLPLTSNKKELLVRSQKSVAFPALALIVSGGHTDLVLLKKHGVIEFLGGTRDDAAGECFDKCARLLGFAYPGGPKISELGKLGNPKAFPFPRPMLGSNNFDFSFSGLKTAFLHETRKHFPILRNTIVGTKAGWQQIPLEQTVNETEKQILYDLCASLEHAIVQVLVKKTILAAEKYHAKSILLGGGVAANQKLRDQMQQQISANELPIKLFIPPKQLCTDNAAMIGAAAFFTGKPTPWQEVNANPELYFC